MRQKRKRATAQNTLSFLDVVSCSFGAVVLLLLIVKTTAPEPEDERNLAEWHAANNAAETRERELREQNKRLAQVLEQLAKSKKAVEDSGVAAMVGEKIKGQLLAALQSLDAEMRALQWPQEDTADVGGIPADSRHIIFVIDTSGSMTMFAWRKLKEQMEAILDAYPKIEGIQVMSDMGEYLFPGYRRRWMKDTPRVRKNILQGLDNWGAFSNSNPVEGIYAAIQTYARKTKKLSVYVMGDDFSGSSQNVLERVESLRRAGGAEVRIHLVGFYSPDIGPHFGAAAVGFDKFARLTALTRKNRGTFIGLTTAE